MSLIKGNTAIVSPKSPKTKGKVVRFTLNYDLKNLFLDVVNEKDRHLYEEFVCKIRDLGQEIRDDELIQILKEARGCISILDRNLILFIQVILLLKWSHRSEDVVQEFQGFLLDLCSAHSYYTKNVLDHLVSYFKIGASSFENGLPDEDDQLHFQNIHNVIKNILAVIPMSRDLLIASVEKSSPYVKKPPSEHACYIYNILQIISYASPFRLDLLKIIIQKIVSIDVSAPKSDSSVDNLLKTLDLCINVFLVYIRRSTHDISNDLDFQATKVLYCDLLKVFETNMLSTHGTTHSQFIMFYTLSLKPVLTVGFLQTLWSKVTNPNVAPIIRQASVSYIASLLTRAAYIPVSLVRDMLSELSNFVHSYIASQESVICVIQDTRIHGVFYSVCQAIFYIIAFRHKELADSKKGLLFLNGLNISKVVQCRMNPLRVCQPIVAQNFANVTRAYQLAYCYSILERNSRHGLPQLTRDQNGCETILQPFLETFFPFDPYCLPLSSVFIKPIYRDYNEEILVEADNSSNNTESGHSIPGKNHEAMQLDEEDDFLEPSSLLSQSPKVTISNSFLSQSPKQSFFAYSNHPGFLHIT